MQVSKSGYTDWQKRLPSRRSLEEQAQLASVRQIHQQSKGTSGSPRFYKELRENGLLCSRNRLVRIMRKYEITARPLRRFVVTTHSDHDLPVADNLLNRQFRA